MHSALAEKLASHEGTEQNEEDLRILLWMTLPSTLALEIPNELARVLAQIIEIHSLPALLQQQQPVKNGEQLVGGLGRWWWR